MKEQSIIENSVNLNTPFIIILIQRHITKGKQGGTELPTFNILIQKHITRGRQGG